MLVGSLITVAFGVEDQEYLAITTVLLLIVFVLMLKLLRRAVDRMIALENPCTWQHVSDAEADLWRAAFADFVHACASSQHLYDHRLTVLDVYSVSNPNLEASFQRVQNELTSDDPNIKRLYHGTSAFAVKQVVAGGFHLPWKPGMFGKGIYFAGTPLKSWQYSTVGFILVCDVALGHEKRAFEANPGLSQQNLQISSSHSSGYDSVVGLPREEGGSLRIPEWVVYNASQALPRVLLRVCRSEEIDLVQQNFERDAHAARMMVKFIHGMFMGFMCGVIFCLVYLVIIIYLQW